MDLLSREDINDTSALNQNFSSKNLSGALNNKMRSTCDGGFAWSVHGPLIVVCALIITFNSVVIALMHWKESLRTLSNTILASLAVSDLMSGLLGIPLIFGCSKAIMTGQIAVCVASTLFMRFTAVSTVLHFLLVACDRYIMIKFSMWHQAFVTKRRVWGALIAIWLIPPLINTIQLAWLGTRNIIEKDTIYLIVFIVAFLAVPMISILCIYAHIIFVSMRHILALRARRANLSDQPINARSITRDLRGTLILISMLVTFAGCWLPFFLMILQDYIGARMISVASWRLCFLLFARFIPPVTNPIFCVFGKRDFRNALRAWVRSRGFSQFCGNVFHSTSRRNVKSFRVEFTSSVDGLANSCKGNLFIESTMAST